MDGLNRFQAPFGTDLWRAIDAAAVEAARATLTGRRFLEVEGPFGPGLTAIERGNDTYCRQPSGDEAGAIVGRAIPVPMLRKTFQISLRRLAGHVDNGQPLDLTPVEDAAEAVARREEEFVYVGNAEFGLPGLTTAEGRNHVDGGDWTTLDRTLQDVLTAVSTLDTGGFRGPYALVLAPRLYNGLFRRYENTDMLQVEHLARLCTLGIHKADIDAAVVVDPRVGKLIVGQDLRAGFAGQDGVHANLYLIESVVLRVDDPGAVCTLSPAGG